MNNVKNNIYRLLSGQKYDLSIFVGLFFVGHEILIAAASKTRPTSRLGTQQIVQQLQ